MPAESSPFKVAIRDIPAHRRIVVSADYVDGLVRGMPLREALEGDLPDGDGGVAELDLDGEGKSFFVQGTISGQVTVACSRCVTAVPIEFAEELRVTYLPAAEVAPEDDPDASPATLARAAKRAAKAEKADAARAAKGKAKDSKAKDSKDSKDDADDLGLELATDDLDVYPYTGDVIDLEPLVREQFVLAVPYAPLCKDDCRGLCPQCGVDRNVTACECEKPIDPRFAALQGLKLPS